MKGRKLAQSVQREKKKLNVEMSMYNTDLLLIEYIFCATQLCESN